MKILKVILIVLIAICSFKSVNAQVVVRARIGDRPVHHRTVVYSRPAYHRGYHRRYYHRRWHRAYRPARVYVRPR